MLKICLSKNIQKSKFPDLTYAWEEWVGKGYQNKENLKFVTSRLPKLITWDNNKGKQLIFTVNLQKGDSEICLVFWKLSLSMLINAMLKKCTS